MVVRLSSHPTSHPSLTPNLPFCPWLELPYFFAQVLLTPSPGKRSRERIFNFSPSPSIPTWSCAPRPVPRVCKTISGNPNIANRESELQVTDGRGGQDAGRTLQAMFNRRNNMFMATISHAFFQPSPPLLLQPQGGQYETPTSPSAHYWLLSRSWPQQSLEHTA